MKWLEAFHQESNQKQGHRREQTRPNDEGQHIGWLIFSDNDITTAPAYGAKNDQRGPHRRYASVSNGKYGDESCKCHAHTGNLGFGNSFAKNDQRRPHRRYASVSNGKYGDESCKCHAHTGNLGFGNSFAKNESRKNDRKEGAELQNQGRDTGGETQIYPQIDDAP